MSMMSSGLCNRIPFRISPFDRDPHSGEPPVATDSWPPFARYDSEGLLGMYGRELKPYIVKGAATTLERTSPAAAMGEKAPAPVEPALLSSGIRRCESLPAFYKNMQASNRLGRRPRQLTNDVAVPRQPRIPVTWTHHSKLSESLHLWNPHEEKSNWAWRGGPIPRRGTLAGALTGRPRGVS
ncbi:hypothetical protein FOZ62_030996 [Perkinsus olseni]|nr:hypothetical protein FOZ62_030996 [Perkinsus olseni]